MQPHGFHGLTGEDRRTSDSELKPRRHRGEGEGEKMDTEKVGYESWRKWRLMEIEVYTLDPSFHVTHYPFL